LTTSSTSTPFAEPLRTFIVEVWAHKFKDPRFGIAMYTAVVANNVMVAAKKVEKTAKKVRMTVAGKRES
jgi:hypothetical protein